ncbi:hypothetical protein [Sinobaca sp. H24]|uniref:hypothetical protein n=1 Tax=Sinobaca sp. H24 TaxID=2923376 RepID=UPI00207A2470|nr:hypothetical protein [Sinobaca sp. H24]
MNDENENINMSNREYEIFIGIMKDRISLADIEYYIKHFDPAKKAKLIIKGYL